MKDLLVGMELSTRDSFVPYYPRVRDREDISVLECKKSGALLLSRTDHADVQGYVNRAELDYWTAGDRSQATALTLNDDWRRAQQLRDVVLRKKFLDVGTGAGGLLDLVSPWAAEVAAVEPQTGARRALAASGYRIYSEIQEVPDNDFEVVSLFHVFEHLRDPVGVLRQIYSRTTPDAKLVIEVPHARDFLISFLECDGFKKHTFWSEHLILHTRETLQRFICEAGFKNVVVAGYQRYPLSNHLYWLSRGKPGGHGQWNYLDSPALTEAYAETLNRVDRTDTLIAWATKA